MNGQLKTDNVKFDMDFQWKLYLSRVGLKEEKLPETQRIELKRAFMGACGQVLMIFSNDIGRLPDENVIEAVQSMIAQVNEFWQKQ